MVRFLESFFTTRTAFEEHKIYQEEDCLPALFWRVPCLSSTMWRSTSQKTHSPAYAGRSKDFASGERQLLALLHRCCGNGMNSAIAVSEEQRPSNGIGEKLHVSAKESNRHWREMIYRSTALPTSRVAEKCISPKLIARKCIHDIHAKVLL